jgi:arginine repressor
MYIFLGLEGHGAPKTPDSKQLEKTELFTCLNHEIKVQIFNELLSGELCVSDLMRKLAKTQGIKIPQATLSGYLNEMHVSRMLTKCSNGLKSTFAVNKIYYSLARSYLENLDRLMQANGDNPT